MSGTTKHWNYGQVFSSKYPGRVLNTYPNTTGQVFQPGTPGAWNEPTFPDIPNATDCQLYWNVRQSQVFQKQGCPTGYTGSNYEYVVAAHTYASGVSQADADNQALADIAANGQTAANTNGYCIQDSSIAILTVDFTSNDPDIDAIMFCSTAGTNRYQQYISRDGNNFLDLADAPANAYGLASDRITQPTLKLRFELNLAKYAENNPGVYTIVHDIQGRKSSAGTVSGSYVLKDPTQGNMIMGGSPGSYIPSVSNPSSVGIVAFTTNVAGGGDGTLGLAVGTTMLRFTCTINPTTGQITVAVTTF